MLDSGGTMKYLLVGIAWLTAVTIAAGQQPQFKSGIEVVYLDVTVQAPDGSIVRGLTKDDFLIYNEGVPQDVAVFSAEPAPISVGVLIDTSGSMTGERMAAAIRAADALGRSLQPGDQWSISVFDSIRRTLIPWRPYHPGVVNSLRAMPTSGSTELFRAVADMVPYMKDTPHRKRAMLLMTDGIDNSIIAASRDGRGDPFEAPGPRESSARTEAALREGEVLLYALGVNVGGRSGEVHVRSLQRLAEPTGGSVIIASTIREVEAAAQRVAGELRQQYTLGFYPRNAGDGTYHRLRVTTRHPDHRIRTRAGYLTANPKQG
jgi:Ca-activated chloride channel family protein